MKIQKVIALIVAFIILSGGATSLFYSLYVIREVRFIDIDFEVRDGVVFNLDNDSMHLGGGPPGGGARREMDISHQYDEPVMVIIHNYGNITTLLQPIEPFELRPGEEKKVLYSIKIPLNATFGQYKGYSKITFKRIF